MLSMKDMQDFELTKHDLKAFLRYGRSVKAFATNRMRAEATRMLERRLDLNQKQFAAIPKIKRLRLVQSQTRILVNELKLRTEIRKLKEK